MKFNEEPTVNFIKVKACFENSDMVGPLTKEKIVTLKKNQLLIDCPMRGWVEGGFNLGSQLGKSELDIGYSGLYYMSRLARQRKD